VPKNNVGLYMFEGGWSHFEGVLLPIARAAHERYGLEAVVVTSHIPDIRMEKLKSYPFISFDRQEVPERWKPFNKPIPANSAGVVAKGLRALQGLISVISRTRFWRARASRLLHQYSPRVIFLQKGNYGEVPFLIQMAKASAVPTVALQTNTGAFGAAAKLREYSRRELLERLGWSRRFAVQAFYFLEPLLQILLYRLNGLTVSLEPFRTKGDAMLFAVENQMFYDKYAAQGQERGSMVITGAPEDDVLADRRQWLEQPSNYLAAREDFGLRPCSFIVVMFLSNGPALWSKVGRREHEEAIARCVRAVSANDDIDLVVKIHPRDQRENYEFLRLGCPAIRLIQDCDAHLLVAAAHCVITDGSSTTRWPLVLGIPVVVWDACDNVVAENAAELFQVPLVRDAAHLAAHVTNILVGRMETDVNPAATAGAVPADGRACHRILDAVEKVAPHQLSTSGESFRYKEVRV
jgi:hypothetical protein